MLHERLKELRARTELTQVEFAQKVGVASSSYAAYENGKKTPNADFIKSVCDSFTVSADWLLGTKKNITTSADILRVLLSMQSAGASLVFVGTEKRIPTALLFLNASSIKSSIETFWSLTELVAQERLDKTVRDKWYAEELDRLSFGEDSAIKPYSNKLARIYADRIEDFMAHEDADESYQNWLTDDWIEKHLNNEADS